MAIICYRRNELVGTLIRFICVGKFYSFI